MDLWVKARMDLGHQIAGQEVKGTVDILKLSVIYLRYFRYFTDISSIFYRYISDILTIFCKKFQPMNA